MMKERPARTAPMPARRSRIPGGKALYLGLRIALGLIFIWAAGPKIVNPADFARIIANYKLLPTALIPAAALILPWIEIICGLLLVCGRFIKGSAGIVNSLLGVFILALIISAVRGLDVQCGCFTVSAAAQKSIAYYLLRDLIFLAMGAWVLYYRLRLDGRQPVDREPSS